MQLIEKRQRETYYGRPIEKTVKPLWLQASANKVTEKGYTLHSLVRLAELLHQKGLLTDEEVLQVFDLDCDWEVAK